MGKAILIIGFIIGFIIEQTYAQEKKLEVENSAEVFLDEYSDDFQELFFEALKQKGIENYDKSINLFLECKLIDKDNKVVDHELAKVYLADKQYLLAQKYGISALVSDPTNLWYLNTIIEILRKQGNTIDNIKSSIPYENVNLKENLALIYFRQKNYIASKAILNNLKKSVFTESLTSKINDSIKREEKKQAKKQAESISSTNSLKLNPLESYNASIKQLILDNNFKQLERVSAEAIEKYPSQPYFYYARGLVLNKNGKYKEAIEILEAGLDYLIGDAISLANDIYSTLSNAYAAINNTEKSNMYLRKIKAEF